MAVTTDKNFLPKSKDIRYLNKDFSQLKNALIDFSKVYFPNTYKDFSDSSPGMMFIEQAAYVGDVLSFYTDYAFKESMLLQTQERRNIIDLAKSYGYKIKPTKASSVNVDIFQLVPASINTNGEYVPDSRYTLKIRENMQLSTNFGQYFLSAEPVDFAIDTKLSPRETTVYSRNSANNPDFFLLKKVVRATSGKIVNKSVSVNAPIPFFTIDIDDQNVIDVIRITDSDNNMWHQVDYLAQELVLDAVPNDFSHEGYLANYAQDVPYILKYLRTPRRFVVNVNEDNTTTIEFGSGVNSFSEEIINLSSKTVGVGLANINQINVPFDPSNFLKNNSYGITPANTTLNIQYIVGGGIDSNCAVGDIRNIVSYELENSSDGLTTSELQILNTVVNSLQVSNSEPATGGKDAETNDEIRQNAIANLAAQNRAVTRDDYLVRLYAMPQKYGSVAKVQIITDNSLDINVKKILTGTVDTNNTATVEQNDINSYFRSIYYNNINPLSINCYILSYDQNKNLTQPNDALVQNIINYLKGYKILTDGINIIDGYVINIGVNFSINIYKGYNKKEVLTTAIQAAKDFFDIDKWEFSQPINRSQLELTIAKIEGVQSIAKLDIVNLNTVNTGENYSAVEYDIAAATKNNIIYPSLDPSIFEVKFPDRDIKANYIV